MELIWLSGNQGIRGNENADECAVHELSLDEPMTCIDILTPVVIVADAIDVWHLVKFQPDVLELPPVEYQGHFGLLGIAKELIPCCLSIGYQ